MTTGEMIRAALKEDLPEGDRTTDNLGISEKMGRCRVLAKEDLVLSGKDLFTETVKSLNPDVQIRWHFEDGNVLLEGQTAASIKGNLVPVLKAERVALNFLGHLSGIATLTRCFVKALGESKTILLDTRKTLPLYRKLEKQAVKDGGGQNHRMSLSDAVMIKENHIRLAGSLTKAVKMLREKETTPITLECSTIEEVKKAIELQVDRILLDNMADETLKTCLEMIPRRIETEASGNMSLERVAKIADFGLTYISIGALTHSAPCADFSLLFDWEG
ncbi:MAG: carboxylating nicotinate-nucleotide diphosphorylase [Bdellovibrionales bacterium]|nr:carboxylating nicotinate-nucleotide diphosphorylase [Bdellovibrionales bacterium]